MMGLEIYPSFCSRNFRVITCGTFESETVDNAVFPYASIDCDKRYSIVIRFLSLRFGAKYIQSGVYENIILYIGL